MNKLLKTRFLLIAAAAAVPLIGLASGAAAQYRVGTDGRALDANNKLGGGGRNPNDADARGGNFNVNQNDVVYGNVSGGRQFRGNLQTTDPRAFRGNTSDRNVDNFVRQSSGPDSRLADQVQPFYGSSRAVPPPPGYVPTAPGQGGFVPSQQIDTRLSSDQRLGDVNLAQPSFALPAPGQLLLPGPVDPSAGAQYITASPLTGIRSVNATDPTFVPTVTNTQYNPVTGRLTPQQIQSMQEELNAAGGTADQLRPQAPGSIVPPQPGMDSGNDNNSGGNNNGQTGTNGGGANGQSNSNNTSNVGAVPIVPQSVQGGNHGNGSGGAAATPIVQQPVNTSVTPLAGDLNTNQSTRNRLVNVPPPQQQSAVYAQLLRNHEQMAQDQGASDVTAQQAFNALQRARQPGQPGALPGQPGAPGGGAMAGGGLPGAPARGGAPGGVAGGAGAAAAGAGGAPAGQQQARGTPGVTDYAGRNAQVLRNEEKSKPTAKKPEPVKVPSLAAGVKGRGLAEVLKNAEALMKDGKFTSALEQYDQAEQVAPNNPLIRLGRANAELGASYYARADAHLREVLGKNPELLGGQYDLMAMLGEQRLQTLVKDLKEIAKKDDREPRPVFLLAYIYYNIGDPARAEGYIDLADKRTGGKDPFYKLLRDNWTLPATDANKPAPDVNAPKPQETTAPPPTKEMNK